MSDPISSLDLDPDLPPDPAPSVGVEPDSGVSVSVRFEPPVHVVALAGELDLTSRSVVHEACSSPDLVQVVVDLSGLTFMDCAGYRALAAARADLERRGGELVLTDAVGGPRRLLALIEELERDDRTSPGAVPRAAARTGPPGSRAAIPTRAITPNEEHP